MSLMRIMRAVPIRPALVGPAQPEGVYNLKPEVRAFMFYSFYRVFQNNFPIAEERLVG
jgi:hypothetical protein